MDRSSTSIPIAAPPRRDYWADRGWWDALIGMAITPTDPPLCNLRITLAHYELSLALRAVLGMDSGANFHTWAVWGSKKAGSTIRQADLPWLVPVSALLGGVLGGSLGAIGLRGVAPTSGPGPRLAGALSSAALGGGGLAAWAHYALNTASRAILGGNITVLDDIGHATAHYVAALLGQPGPAPARLQRFLDSLRPGPATRGGQDLLKEAFTHYDQARLAPTLAAKHEQMLLGNLKAILHEHLRLQPYIAGAMPRLTRRLITSRLLNYQLGAVRLSVYHDVPAPVGAPPGFPATLAHLANPDLLCFLDGAHGWDRTPDSLAGSAATDWTDIRDRMNYICDLFRAHHCDASLFATPYNAAQCADVAVGRIPDPPL
jgi:hypothetical protein